MLFRRFRNQGPGLFRAGDDAQPATDAPVLVNFRNPGVIDRDGPQPAPVDTDSATGTAVLVQNQSVVGRDQFRGFRMFLEGVQKAATVAAAITEREGVFGI